MRAFTKSKDSILAYLLYFFLRSGPSVMPQTLKADTGTGRHQLLKEGCFMPCFINSRTIIKARGLWYPNVNGKTFAVFRTDRKNHLVSLVRPKVNLKS